MIRPATRALPVAILFLLAGCQANPAEALGYDLTGHARSYQQPAPATRP